MTQRLLIIHNPVAGNPRRELYRTVLSNLENLGCSLTVVDTTEPGDAAAHAREARPFDRIVVVGGDGTFNEVVNGVAETSGAPPLAIIPEGTSNVLAAEIGIGRSAERITKVILHGRAIPISLGRVNGRYFAVMMGAGLDAHLVAKVDLAMKQRLGARAYVASLFQQLHEFSFPEYRVTIDGKMHMTRSVIIANASRYSQRWKIAPMADLRHSHLNICHIGQRRLLGNIGAGITLFGGRLTHGRGLRISDGHAIHIDGPSGDPVQADGDIVATLPVEVVVRPQAVRVLYPV